MNNVVEKLSSLFSNAGGFTKHSTLTPHAIKVYHEAIKGTELDDSPYRLGYQHTLVSPYYSQIVNGTNYIFTVEGKVVSPDAKPTFISVHVYEDLHENVVLESIIYNNPKTRGKSLTDFAQDLFLKFYPNTHLVGAKTSLDAVYAQSASGTNYCFEVTTTLTTNPITKQTEYRYIHVAWDGQITDHGKGKSAPEVANPPLLGGWYKIF